MLALGDRMTEPKASTRNKRYSVVEEATKKLQFVLPIVALRVCISRCDTIVDETALAARFFELFGETDRVLELFWGRESFHTGEVGIQQCIQRGQGELRAFVRSEAIFAID